MAKIRKQFLNYSETRFWVDIKHEDSKLVRVMVLLLDISLSIQTIESYDCIIGSWMGVGMYIFGKSVLILKPKQIL